MLDLAGDMIGISSVVASTATLIGVIKTHSKVSEGVAKVDAVQGEIETVNGISLGGLVERQEGRRIAEIPHNDRTLAEQGYVDNLEKGGRGL